MTQPTPLATGLLDIRRGLGVLTLLAIPLLPSSGWTQQADDSDSSVTPQRDPASTSETTTVPQSPSMLDPWTGPYGGVPPWHLVRTDQFTDAFTNAIGQAETEIQRIATQADAATFENTILAMETAGESLQRLQTLFDVHASNLNVGPIPDLERVVGPMLAEHADWVTQNAALFDRIRSIYLSEEAMSNFDSDQRRLVEEYYRDFVRRGAKLDDSGKARLAQINRRLARLFTDFSLNVLEDEKGYVTWIDDPAKLDGLPESVLDAMSSAARERGGQAKWAVTNTRSSMDPFLTYAANRQLRKKVWTNYYSRGENGDANDNAAIIREILALRLERAKLLGYATHAHWRLEPTMAKTPEAAMTLMMSVWPKAVARVREEVADMQAVADAENAGITIAPWDYRFYAEKVRTEKYDLDFNLVKPYLALEKLREGMFWSATQLFGLHFRPVTGVPVFHPDVRVWEVTDDDGEHVGLWYLDPYARTGKRSGAWMTDYRPQHRVGKKQTPIVSNNSNFIKGDGDDVVLISWDDAVTLFHEFGHALHGLCSDVNYPSQSGTNVARDYVEFPSQIFEHWLSTDEVLQRFARHYESDQPMPAELLEKIKRAATFNSGFDTVEYLASAIVDMKIHMRTEMPIDAAEFEKNTLAEIGMPAELPMRHRLPHFSHIFSSDSYSAGYYSYMWADTLTADAAEAFEQSDGGYFDAVAAKNLLDNVMRVGDTVDATEAFRRFRGRDVDTGALLRKRGFPTESQ